MRLLIGFDVECDDEVAAGLVRGAGKDLAPADVPMALALVALAPFRDQVRDLLLAEDHAPVTFNTPTRMTTDRSAVAVTITLTTPEPENKLWTTPSRESSSKPAKRTAKKRAAQSGSPSKSRRRGTS
jgi:hypothetical protein